MRHPVLDQVVPGVGLVATILLLSGFRQERRVVDPPDRAGAEAVDGFGPELVPVAGERRDVDGAAAEGPETAVAGLVAQWSAPIEVVRLEGSDEPELRRIEEMGSKRPKPEEIVSKLRQVEVLQGQGMSIADAVRQIGVTQQTYYRWRKLYGGMGREQLKRLKQLEKENQRLRRAVSDLTLDKLILTEAAQGNF